MHADFKQIIPFRPNNSKKKKLLHLQKRSLTLRSNTDDVLEFYTHSRPGNNFIQGPCFARCTKLDAIARITSWQPILDFLWISGWYLRPFLSLRSLRSSCTYEEEKTRSSAHKCCSVIFPAVKTTTAPRASSPVQPVPLYLRAISFLFEIFMRGIYFPNITMANVMSRSLTPVLMELMVPRRLERVQDWRQ